MSDERGDEAPRATRGGRVPPVERHGTTDRRTLPWATRFRLMIETLWDELSEADPLYDAARQTLGSIHQQAREEEESDLAKTGMPRHYYIIRPVNPLDPPAAEDIARIADAITTLAALGMICAREGDEPPD
jgi:hypothetical protein